MTAQSEIPPVTIPCLTAKSGERNGLRERYLPDYPQLHYKDKPGWLRFGYPLPYNSEALEAVRAAANGQMRWKLRNLLAIVKPKSPSAITSYRGALQIRPFGT
jgi:hypothetical protein